MSEARRIRATARAAWREMIATFRAMGVSVEAWPEDGAAPPPRSYGTAIDTRGQGLEDTQAAVRRQLGLLYLRLEKERQNVSSDAVVFVKAIAEPEVRAHEVRLACVLGFLPLWRARGPTILEEWRRR